MKGRVELINHQKEMAAVITENGGYTSFELLGDEVEIGDVISGDLEALGGETFRNETQDEDIEVSVEDIHGSRESALQAIS